MVHLPFSMAEEETWYENMLKSPRKIILHGDRDEPYHSGWERIGNCGLFGYDWIVRQSEFGDFHRAKSYGNGRGYGTEAFKLMIEYGI